MLIKDRPCPLTSMYFTSIMCIVLHVSNIGSRHGVSDNWCFDYSKKRDSKLSQLVFIFNIETKIDSMPSPMCIDSSDRERMNDWIVMFCCYMWRVEFGGSFVSKRFIPLLTSAIFQTSNQGSCYFFLFLFARQEHLFASWAQLRTTRFVIVIFVFCFGFVILQIIVLHFIVLLYENIMLLTWLFVLGVTAWLQCQKWTVPNFTKIQGQVGRRSCK